jgi:hypothetical protein
MPRYESQNLAAVDPEYRKAHNIGSGGASNTKKRYAYGKQGNVLVAQGNELFANGMCLRFLPLYEEIAKDDAGNRQFVNFREGRDNVAFGDWARRMTCAHWVGNPGVCFVIHDGNPNIDLYSSPYHVLRNAAYNCKDNPGTGRLFTELLAKPKVMKSHIGSLTKPEQILFVSASVVFVSENGRDTLLGAFSDDQKRNARIIGLKTSAQQALYSALRVQDPATGEFMSGDMLSFSAAKLMTFLPESYVTSRDQQKVLAVGERGPETFDCPTHARSTDPHAKYVVGYPQSRSEYTHYAVIHDKFFNHDITLNAYADKLVAESLSWDEYIWVPTYEEQAEMLATAFPREALDYAWREHPEYLRTIPKNTSTFEGAGLPVDELEEAHMAPRAPAPAPARPAAHVAHTARPAARPAPTPDPVAPWDMPEAELSADEEAGVADMFSAPSAPTLPPPAMPAQPSPAAGKADSADILAKARARAAAKK